MVVVVYLRGGRGTPQCDVVLDEDLAKELPDVFRAPGRCRAARAMAVPAC